VLTARIQITGLLPSQKPGAGAYTGILPEAAPEQSGWPSWARTPGTPQASWAC
jgi:hypothetical protein